jgi:hypothetical protein
MTDLNSFLSNPPACMRRNHVRFRGACTLAAGEAGRFILVRTGSRKARTPLSPFYRRGIHALRKTIQRL